MVAAIRADGSNDRALAPSLPGGHQSNPDWSPDGKRVVFALQDEDGTEDLWVMRADGTRPRLLLECEAPCVYLDDPSWSPDGRSVAYSKVVDRGGAGIGTLETVGVRSGRIAVVLGPSRRSFTAGVRWSPDGQRLAFERVQKAGTSLDAEITGVALNVVRIDRPRTSGPSPTPPCSRRPPTGAPTRGGSSTRASPRRTQQHPTSTGFDRLAVHQSGSPPSSTTAATPSTRRSRRTVAGWCSAGTPRTASPCCCRSASPAAR